LTGFDGLAGIPTAEYLGGPLSEEPQEEFLKEDTQVKFRFNPIWFAAVSLLIVFFFTSLSVED